MIGRHPERSDPGLIQSYIITAIFNKFRYVQLISAGVIRALIDPYLHKARTAGVPVWLEAISDHGRQVYEHLSFRTVAEVRLGVGKVNADGILDENGEGLVVYGMVAE